MKLKTSDLSSSAFWLALSIFVCVLAARIGIGSARSPGAGLFIFLSSAVMGLLSIALAILSLSAESTKQGVAGLWKGKQWVRVALVVGALTAYAVLLEVLGFIVTTFFTMAFLFLLSGVRRLPICAGAALLTAVISYVVFDLFLGVPLPRGLL